MNELITADNVARSCMTGLRQCLQYYVKFQLSIRTIKHSRGGMAEWLVSPDWDRKVVDSNPGVARSDGQ